MKQVTYSQGVCMDGAAIMKDGQMMTVDEIVAELNALADTKPDHIAQADNTGADSKAILHESPELTDEEVAKIMKSYGYCISDKDMLSMSLACHRALIAAHEAKRGVK